MYKNEKEIQELIRKRISYGGYKYDIINEEGKNLGLNNEHPYLIINPFEKIRGLTNNLIKNNKVLIEKNSKVYSESELINILKNDFIEKYNKAKNNSELYKLIFEPGSLSIELKDENNISIIRDYNVISHNNYADNEFYIIKEKRIETSSGVERPDFAMYINSIPLIVFEVKTPKAGLDAAFKDYISKKSYHKFILCLGTDGNEAFFTGSKVQKFKWKKYGDNKIKNIFDDVVEFINNEMNEEKEKIFKEKIDNSLSKQQKIRIINILDNYLIKNISNIYEGLYQIRNKETKNLFIEDISDIINNETTGLEDFIEEFIDNPKNLFFYMKNCILIDKDKETYEYLINHRVQQYYTIKKLNHKMKIIALNEDKKIEKKHSLLNELVVHVQRSGKSITIRSAVNLIEEKYSKIFKKIYICVPDLTIKKVMEKTFKNNKVKIKKINSRFDYIKSISEEPTEITFYLYNIQKTTDDNNKINSNIKQKYLNSDVLFIIDEVHFAQDKQQADIRRANFPNASFLSFTATPKIKERSKEKINYTATLYSDADRNGMIHYLDELILEEAIKMEIVLPVRFEKFKINQDADIEASKEVDIKIAENIHSYLKIGEHKKNIEQLQEEEEIKIKKLFKKQIEENKKTEEDLAIEIKNSNHRIYTKYFNDALKEAEKVESEHLLKKLRKEKINYIIKDMNIKREKCYSTNGILNFKTKAFIVVKSQSEAQKYIETIREMSKDNNNYYNGYRFGVDFSQQQISTSDVNIISTLNGINSDEKIIDLFESQTEKRVDILIIVDKYLMGYDNKELVCVYCDKIINEPAKLFQLITRSATVRNGKKQGFFVDMNFSDDNYDTYVNKSLAYYNSGGAKIATLTEVEVQIQKEKIKSYLNNIKNILDIPQEELLIDTIGIYKKLTSKDKSEKSVSDIIRRKNNYFEEFRKINNVLEILINPKYYLEQFDEILTLSKVNIQYLNENMPKNKDNDIIFDRNEIEQIILKSIRFFDFESSEAFNSFRVNESIAKNDVQHGKMEFNNFVDDFKCQVAISRGSYPLGFTEMITKWSEQIMSSSDAKIKINEFIEEYVKPFEQEKEKRKKEIEEIFAGSECHYISYQRLKKIDEIIKEKIAKNNFSKKTLNQKDTLLSNQLISKEIINNFVFEYSKIISQYIEEFCFINNESFNDINLMIEKFKKINTESFENIIEEKIKEINNKDEIFKLMRKDQKRIKELLLSENDLINFEIKIDDNLDLPVYLLIITFEDFYYHKKNEYITN